MQDDIVIKKIIRENHIPFENNLELKLLKLKRTY